MNSRTTHLQQPRAFVKIKYTAGAHTTQTISGHRASSTSSAETAAIALGRKLYGEDFDRVSDEGSIEPGVDRFWIYGRLPTDAERESS